MENVELPFSGKEFEENFEKVRRSYLNHLHRILSENCIKWAKKSGEQDQINFTNTEISKFAMLLERRALKASVMANLYQRSMVQVMREVKKYTGRCLLFKDLLEEKDLKMNGCCDRETQTDSNIYIKRVSNVKINDKSKGFPYSPAGNSVKDAVAMVSPLQKNNVTIEKTFELQKDKYFNGVSILSSQKDKDISLEISKSLLEGYETPFEEWLEKTKITYKSSSEKRKMPLAEVGSENPIKKICKPQKYQINATERTSLDDRLSKFASLFGDSEASSQDCEIADERSNEKPPVPVHRPKLQVFDWHVEFIAQVCNLNRVLLRLNPQQRAHIEKRFKDLFGGENDPITNLCPSEVTYCRKRIADMVVNELTRFYVSCRIGSKHMFKQLAKHITNNILKKTYAPDLEEIVQSVDKIFNTGRSIMTADDLTLVLEGPL